MTAGDSADLPGRCLVYSTMWSIVLSVADFALHVAVAIWLTMNYWGYHQAVWVFIVLALIANLVAIIIFIGRNVR